MKLTGAEIIIECLKEQQVNTVFGYPGGTVISVYDALYRRGGGIRHILTSHEQGAAHAADGYARATGKTGVCLVTSGPGATNLVTGIATAYMDSVPLVAITINVPVSDLGKDSFQEVDIAGITMPVTKHNFIVKNIEGLAPTLRRAFTIASLGRPGPVLVDITRNVTEESFEYEPERNLTTFDTRDAMTAEEKEEFMKLFHKSERPLLLVGGGAAISGAQESVALLAKRFKLPVVDTLMGKGVYNGNEEAYLGMVGIYGTEPANRALSECDLLIALGARFSERLLDCEAFPKECRIIQIDIDRAELNKNVRDELAICGDIKSILSELLCEEDIAESGSIRAGQRRERWLSGLIGYKKNLQKESEEGCNREGKEGKAADGEFSGSDVVKAIYRLTGGKAVLATEVGLNQMWAAREYSFSYGRQLITSGGLGTMGYGLSAAIGAQLGRPESLVVNIAGDGCFRMNMNELITANRYKLPIIEVILDNRMLGMVHEMQRKSFDGRYSQTEFGEEADYVKIAEGCGAVGFTATCIKEFEEAFKKALALKKLCVIECRIDG